LAARITRRLQGDWPDLDKEEFQKTVTVHLGVADSSERNTGDLSKVFHNKTFAQKFI
jgi:hypothetical protein